ncbi:U-box domain-containing protein 13 [Hibiscus syriacus]|uniref:RING-type E3 ubiquitin transferase n=1 Tax=Hibiscus syriacus TaxID=106335 RepID=A0A6A2ZXL2_HIBSY|nr:U-box domain-containing protein 13 [Hibiscus syriacus]
MEEGEIEGDGSWEVVVLERDQIMHKFHEVTARVEQALSGIPYENLDISDGVKEQFRRARVDAADVELCEDLLSLHSRSSDAAADPDGLRRLAEKLQLVGVAELTQESLALHEMVSASGGDPGETFEKMSNLLKKIKDFVETENPNLDAFAREKNLPPSRSGQATTDGDHKTPVIPDDFCCPISLELMKDPIIVSTGQTYERSCIEKWLEQAQWCEANGIEPPKRPSSSQPNKTTSACSPAERTKIEILLRKLASCSPEDQRMAAGEIRLLAKQNADNRVAIAEAGAIPLLVTLLSTPDSRTQEHAVTALLNLSICEDNKGSIMSFGAVPGIVQVLKKGSMEARENAAAALFSLSVVDENKQGNKGKAVRAGVVPTLTRLLTEPGGGMVDEALAILAILSSHPEGKPSIVATEAVPVLVDVIGNGSPRNRENAAAILIGEKRKAAQLLERMSRFLEQQKLVQAQAEAHTPSETQHPQPSSVAYSIDR